MGQSLYSGQGHDPVCNQATSPNVLSILAEIHALGSSYSRKISTVAHPPAPLQPGQLLCGQLLYGQPPQRTVTHASAGPKCNQTHLTRMSQYVRKGAGEGGGVHFLHEWFCLGFSQDRRAWGDSTTPTRDTRRTGGAGIYELSPFLLWTSLAFPFSLVILLLSFFFFSFLITLAAYFL